MTPLQLSRLMELRKRMFSLIKRSLALPDSCSKSAEGIVELNFPDYFHSQEPDSGDTISLTIHCYVLFPKRHTTFTGSTDDVLNQFERMLDHETGEIVRLETEDNDDYDDGFEW